MQWSITNTPVVVLLFQFDFSLFLGYRSSRNQGVQYPCCSLPKGAIKDCLRDLVVSLSRSHCLRDSLSKPRCARNYGTMHPEAHSYEVHSRDARNHIHVEYIGTSCALDIKFLWSSHGVHMKFKSFEINMNFICISYELFMSLMSTSLVSHAYNILTSSVLRYEVHMNFIRTACKFIWINLILFHIKFIRSSYELHMTLVWS